MDKPLISVIVPVYKVEPYLHRCADSILAQTFKKFELILVDDGSPDNCPQICDEYSEKDNRVKVIHKANGGLGSARNAGLDIAVGEYLAFVDSDDYIGPTMLEKMLNSLEGENADICICGFQRFGELNSNVKTTAFAEYTVISGEEALGGLFSNNYILFTIACNKLLKRQLFNTLRFPEGKLYEDGYAAFRYLYEAKKVVCLKESFYFYRIRQGSITTTENHDRIIDSFSAETDAVDFLRSSGLRALMLKAQKRYLLALVAALRRYNPSREEISEQFKEVHKEYRRQFRGLLLHPDISGKEKVVAVLFRLSPRLCQRVIRRKGL